jgi:NodT family efflux transporter outer membrane factor (OMF) lipoprotein
LAILAWLPIAGCAVGPNFTQPAPPAAKGYTSSALTTTASTPNVGGGDAQHFIEGRDIPGEWWTLFQSEPLNRLIERSLANNHDLKAAQAALHVSRENVLAHRGVFVPNLSGSFGASRQSQSESLAPVPNANVFEYNLFTPQVTVSYMPDVFGLNRRTAESLRAQEQAVRMQMIATHLTLSANVVVAAIQEASLRAQMDAAHQLIDINSNLVQILRLQFTKGMVSQVEVAAQEAQLAQVRTTLAPLRKQLAQQRDLLAVLAGDFPSQGIVGDFDLASLQLPKELPVSLPSQLVGQRPDVRQAEANLHAASAQIGIATANRLPNLTLSASTGSTALAVDQLFTSGTGFWTLGAALSQPLFQGGALLHAERAAKAAYVQATEQYRSTVLTAFQNVADTLNALDGDAEALQAAAAAQEAAEKSLELTRTQLKFGFVSYAVVLAAEQTYEQAVINQVQARASRYADTAALFQALGGGWWNRPSFTKDSHEP